MTSLEIKNKIEDIKRQIEALQYNFCDKENEEDFDYEKEYSLVSLEDALDVIERDAAYRELKKQMVSLSSSEDGKAQRH